MIKTVDFHFLSILYVKIVDLAVVLAFLNARIRNAH